MSDSGATNAVPYFFSRDGEVFQPTGLGRSPWEREKMNGVALGGLLVHLMDGVPSPTQMVTARLTIDILGAAPMAPVLGRSQILREGSRIQLAQTELVIEDRVVARATALRVRVADTPRIERANHYPPPEDVPPAVFLPPRAFAGTLETRRPDAAQSSPGSGVLWVRFGHEHVAGYSLTPLVRVATLGDFGGGVSGAIDGELWSYANLDIAVHLTREPEGDWLLMDATMSSAGNGVAITSAVMADRRGPFAESHQTLFIAPRA